MSRNSKSLIEVLGALEALNQLATHRANCPAQPVENGHGNKFASGLPCACGVAALRAHTDALRVILGANAQGP